MNIAVIGFGATGVSFFINLIHTINTDITKNFKQYKITIISRKHDFIGGIAFNSNNKEHIVNTPAYLMSCYENDSLHFVKWLKTKDIYTLFPPRHIFKEYLQEQFLIFLKKAKAIGIIINIIDDFATSLYKKDNSFYIGLKNNKTIIAKKVIYSAGHYQQSNILNNSIAFNTNIDVNTLLNKDNSVGILGSGLTTIDAVLSLQHINKISSINIFSRNGLLPSINLKDPKIDISVYKYFNKENISSAIKQNTFSFFTMLKLIYKELTHYNEHELKIAKKYFYTQDMINFYYEIIQLSEKNILPLNQILSSSRYYFKDLWQEMNLKQKLVFLDFARYFNIFRNTIPLENAKKILLLLQQKKLYIFKISNIVENNNQIEIMCNNNVYIYPNIITTYQDSFNILKKKSVLNESMLQNNLIELDDLGGIKVNKTYESHENLYILGDLLKSSFYVTNSFWFNSMVAKDIAQNIIARDNQQ